MTVKADLEDLQELTALCSKLTELFNGLVDTVNALAEAVENLGEDVAMLQTDNPSKQIESLKDAVAKHTDIPRWQLD
tara:strand:+ start:45 stop:275 length:231 start_codon:yes stop_codon:yes gene_type:complete